MRIDHVIYGVRDLDAAAERFESEFGLASYAGGEHAAWGTANRIVPLGAAYIELIGVVDPQAAASSPLGDWIGERTADGDRFVGWCVAPDDLDATAARLGLTTIPASRTLPDGSELTWRLAGIEVAMTTPPLPFFIAWDVGPELHPGAGGPVGLAGIEWVELSGDPQQLEEWLAGASVPLRYVDGPLGVQAIGIGKGRIAGSV